MAIKVIAQLREVKLAQKELSLMCLARKREVVLKYKGLF